MRLEAAIHAAREETRARGRKGERRDTKRLMRLERKQGQEKKGKAVHVAREEAEMGQRVPDSHNLLAAAVHGPVVPVKRHLVAQEP